MQPSTGATSSPTILVTQSAVGVAAVSSTLVPNVEQSNGTTSGTTHMPSVGASIGDADAVMQRILHLAEELDGQCRTCWVNGDVGRMHYTYQCNTGICSGNGWKMFKAKTTFPRAGVLPVFWHVRPSFQPRGPSARFDVQGRTMRYPDILKELVYIIFHSEERRNAVFAKLEHLRSRHTADSSERSSSSWCGTTR